MKKEQLNNESNLQKVNVHSNPAFVMTNIREKCIVILTYLFEQGPHSYEWLVNEMAESNESPMQPSTLQSHIEKTATMNSEKAKYYKKRLPKLLNTMAEFREFKGDFDDAYTLVITKLTNKKNNPLLSNKPTNSDFLSEHSNNRLNNVVLSFYSKVLFVVVGILLFIMLAYALIYKENIKRVAYYDIQVATRNIGYTIGQHKEILKEREKQLQRLYQERSKIQYKENIDKNRILSLEKKLLENKISDIQNQLSNVSNSYLVRISLLENTLMQLHALNADVDQILFNEAEAALLLGFTDKADELFQLVEGKAQTSINRAAQSAFQRGLIAENNGHYREAFSHYQRAIGYSPTNAEFFEVAGLMAGMIASYDKQQQWTEISLRLYKQKEGNNSADIARIWNNLGLVWQNKGQYKKAIDYFELALASDLINFNEYHSIVTERRSNLGLAWFNHGNNDKAIEYFNLALTNTLKIKSNNHPQVATIYNHLGLAWNDKGEYDKAIDYFEQALTINLNTLGKNHPNVARNRNNLGLAWRLKGNYEKAINYYEKTLASNLMNWQEEHPKTARSYNNLGVAWYYHGDNDKATEYFERALNINLVFLGEDHPSVSLHRSNLGKIYYHKGEYDVAIKYYQLALASSLEIQGDMHPTVAREHNNLGEVWVAKGEYNKAIDYYELALKNNRQTFGDTHPHIARNHHNLGIVWYKKDTHLDKSLSYFQLAFDTRKQMLGEKHPDTQSTKKWISILNADGLK
ncbi:MAG: tetratricopeptide (TPR) repeat protein [Alteromonadaceae bacterium]